MIEFSTFTSFLGLQSSSTEKYLKGEVIVCVGDSMKGKKCDLCGWEIEDGEEYYLNGKTLCWQCWIGEVENPEHMVI